MNLAGGNDRKARQVAVVIEQQMQLDRSLGGAKLRPVMHAQAQIDHRGVQAHQLVLESELLRLLAPWQSQLRLETREEPVEEILVQLPRSMLVHVGQR